MADRSELDRLLDLVRASGEYVPTVEPVDIHLRSGINFVFRDPQKRGVPPDRQDIIRTGLETGWLIGSFIAEWGYDVPRNLIPQFERWLERNEAGIASSQPQGVHYRGTYAVFSSSEKGSGSYRTIWTFDSFAAMQDFGFRLADDSTPFTRLMAELLAFVDHEHVAGRSQQIYLPAQGTRNLAGLGLSPVAKPMPP